MPGDPSTAPRRPAPAGPGVGWLRRLGPFLRDQRRTFAGAVALSVVTTVFLGLVPLVQSVVIDDAVLADRKPVGPWVAVLVAVGAASWVTGVGRRYLGARAALDVQHALRTALHHHLVHLDFARHDALSTGDVMSRAAADVTLVQLFLQQAPIVVANLTLLVVSLAAMLVLSPLLTLVVAVCVPVFAVLAIRFRDGVFPASWNDQDLAGAVAGIVDEATSGVRVVKGFAQEDREQRLLVGRARDLFGSRMRTARMTATYGATLQAIPALGQVGVLAFGGWLALRGQVTVGVFSAFASYLVQLVAPVRMLSGVMSTSQQARAGAERILELLDLEPRVTERPGAVAVDRRGGRVEVDDVTFAYGDGEPVLRGVSFTVEPGEVVALVGASGSGKSTLAHLVARFYDPASGTVRIAGHDVRDLQLGALRRAVGVVHEEAFLFSASLRENIAFARPDATDDEVVAAARAAQADGFVRALPDGYDTVVGERGFTLSGGQRQRIALARAALANPGILLLDDATSAIDARTEGAIHASFDAVMAGRTTILVAHRASTLRLAHRVLVLDRGRIVAEGTHAGLLRSSALYRELLAGPDEAVAPGDAARPVVTAVDPAAWPAGAERDGPGRQQGVSAKVQSLVGLRTGPGPGGAAAGLGAGAALATVTPELLARVDALPPIRDTPTVDVDALVAEDVAAAAAPAGRAPSLARRLVRPVRAALAVGAALVAVDAATTLVGPLLVRHGIDGVSGGDGGTLAAAAAAYLAVQLVSWGNAVAMARQTARTAESVLFGLRARAFAHLQRLSLDFYDREMGGRIMTRMTTDVEALASLLQQGVVSALASLLSSVGIVVVLVALDARLALAAVAVLPVLAVMTTAFYRASGRAYLVARERVSAVNADMQEGLSGVRVIQALARQDVTEARFAALSRGYRDARMRSMLLVSLYFPALQLLTAVAKALTLFVAAGLVSDGRLTEGVLVAFLVYLDQFFAPIQQLSMVFDQWVQARVSLGRIDELLRTPTGTPPPARPVPIGRLRGDVRFDAVRFAYASTGLEALKGFDLHVRPGEVVALVGTTGAGKSTVVKVASRFYDVTGGRVLVDGVPVDRLDPTAFRRQLGYVPQEPFLFSGTIRSNIAYGRPDAGDLDVERAARAVGAHAFVAGLPEGYLTPVTERGRSMSAGERQLLCLARAELVDPAVLILDEATANLDLATEAKVQRAMARVARGRTTLLIAHRLQTARAADRIVVVEDGRVVEQGPHDALVAAEGPYAALWAAFTEAAEVVPPG